MSKTVGLSESERQEIEEAERNLKEARKFLEPRSQRIRMEAKITLRSQTNFFVGFSENISEGGIFIATQSPPDIGEKVEITIPLLDGTQSVNVEGIVRWHRSMSNGMPAGCGVQFTQISDGAASSLEEVVRILRKEPLFVDL
ncbi:MAG: TIGR02266 family protein [Myxococcota bacterium]|nr:TIGR02266 family protein [Myxococcota bacterium]